MVSDKGDKNIHSFSTRAILVSSICMTAILGFFGGVTYGTRKDVPYHPIQFIDDINPYVPYIKISNITDRELSLETLDHSLRIENGKNIHNAPPNTTFTVPINVTLSSAQSSPQKATCNFVAAKTGKYLYPADSTQAKKLSSTKRCFSSSVEGEKEGLILWDKKEERSP